MISDARISELHSAAGLLLEARCTAAPLAIVTGYAGVSAEGRSPFYRMLMIDDDASVPAYRKLTEALRP